MKKAQSDFNFVGVWHIYEMSNWYEDYFNRSVQAFIEIHPHKTGEFQFGLVSGDKNWKLSGNRLTFTWDGQDEMDEASGSAWLQPITADELKGEIQMYYGDNSLLKARKAS